MKRERIELTHGWRFLRDEAPDAWLPGFDDSSWEEVSVPHCFNSDDTFTPERGHYRGPGWYRIDLPELPRRKRVELNALGAFSLTHVWLNGDFLGIYQGGYTGFRINLSAHLGKKKNLLVLRVTNQHNSDVLPGKDNPDYNLYGGIYREIGLEITDGLHLSGDALILSTPHVCATRGTIHANVRVRNDRKRLAKARIGVEVLSPKGKVVAEGHAEAAIAPGAERIVNVPLPDVKWPKLWSPDDPALYTVRAKLRDKDRTLDKVRRNIGFRWFAFDADRGFFLNDEPVKLCGMNRHQDYPGIGNALPASFQAYDAVLLKELGVNFVRCSHYPMHPAFLDACDQLGIVVYEEIASWQYIGGKQFAANAVQMMEEMISRDRHHPSIVLWGLLNEGRSRELFQLLHDTAHRLDPWRLTVYAENDPEEGSKLGSVLVPDVLGLNYKVPHLDELRELLPGMRLMNSEHSNANTAERASWEGAGGKDWVDDELWQRDKIFADLDEFAKRDWMAGSALWCMHDYGTDYEPSWPIQRSGCFDSWRIPKLSAHAIRARWSSDPFTHILGHWSWPEGDASEKRVAVASNAESVNLLLNGRSLGTKARGQGFEWKVPYQPGELRAIGTHPDGGRTEHKLSTAGEPAALVIDLLNENLSTDQRDATLSASLVSDIQSEKLPADGTDITLICVTVVDAHGNWVPNATVPVAIEIDGPGTLFGVGGIPEVAAVAGRGRIVYRAGREPGKVRIVATSDGLASGAAMVKLTA